MTGNKGLWFCFPQPVAKTKIVLGDQFFERLCLFYAFFIAFQHFFGGFEKESYISILSRIRLELHFKVNKNI